MAILSILWLFGIFCDHLGIFIAFCFGIWSVLVCCTKKNLAILVGVAKMHAALKK
jgi:hypothetical protein